MATVTFTGRCWPPFQEPYQKSGAWPTMLQGTAHLLQMRIQAEGDQLTIQVSASTLPHAMPPVLTGDLRNRARELAHWTLNVHAFATGEFRSLELIAIETPRGPAIFGGSQTLSAMRKGKPAAIAAASSDLALSPVTIQFLAALKSLQLAIMEPEETAFLAYRAIETLRHAYYKPDENRKKAASETWGRMWADLGLKPDKTRAIQDNAESIRHGGSADNTWSERQEAVAAALEVLDAFALKHVWPRT